MNLIQTILKTVYEKYGFKPTYYVMNRNTREAVDVPVWLNKNITDNKDALEKILVDNNLVGSGHDITIINILKWATKNYRYVQDRLQYKNVEYWASVDETIKNGKGDCEDVAVLIFCLARVAGISHNQIHIIAGDVVGGGHCWVSYRSHNYPYVEYFIDWCYWVNTTIIRQRKAYLVKNNKVVLPTESNYLSIWFRANDKSGFL